MPSQVTQPTLGSGLGLHCPYRRGIFLSTPPARPIWTAHGQGGAHWIGPHHTKPHAQAQLFFQSLILPFALHFHPPAECNFCWRQLFQSDFSFSSFQISHRQQFCIFSSMKRYICPYLRWNRGRICEQAGFHIFQDLFWWYDCAINTCSSVNLSVFTGLFKTQDNRFLHCLI